MLKRLRSDLESMASSEGENAKHEEERRDVLEIKDMDSTKKEVLEDHQSPLQNAPKSSSGNGQHRKATSSKDHFCENCSKVAFDAMLVGSCNCTNPNGLKAIGEIKLATVETIFANEECPGCRLFASLIRSHPNRVPRAAVVKISACYYDIKRRDGSAIQGRPGSRLGWIEVEVCSHGLHEGEAKDDYVGSLLPLKGTKPTVDADRNCFEELDEAQAHEKHIFVREIPRIVNCGLLRAWMRFCEENHNDCKNTMLIGDEETSIRLIDVWKRRLVNANLKVKYVAVSYVWGKNTKGVLSKSTEELFQQEGSLNKESVPRIVFDVMELVAELGMQYLWVDTACIIQDDAVDQHYQLPIMDSIYSHADLVIITAIDNANFKLPRWKESPQRTKLPVEMLRGVRFSTGQISLEHAMKHAVWNRRGWTFQEGLLARKRLVFTKYQVYWQCCEEVWCEDRFMEFKDFRNKPNKPSSLFPGFTINACGNAKVGVRETCPIGEYRHRVAAFSERLFTNGTDTFWAFMGVLKSLKDNFPRGYIWGLPYDILDVALLWQADCARNRNFSHILQDRKGDSRQYPIPSWSWMSKGCHVEYDTCGGSLVSLVKWHKPLRYPVDCDWSTRCNECFVSKSTISVGAEGDSIEPGLAIFDFGLLHFTAQAAKLRLQGIASQNIEASFLSLGEKSKAVIASRSLVQTRIQLASGKDIGEMRVPLRILFDGKEDQREFISLSTYTDEQVSPVLSHTHGQNDGPHVPGCKHSPKMNIMLIEWEKNCKGASFATRVAIGRIQPSVWKEAGAREKDVILA